MNNLNISKDLENEYSLFDNKLEVIENLLKKLDDINEFKFAIYNLRQISTFTFDEGEENIFNTENMYNIFDSVLNILKITQDDQIKVITNKKNILMIKGHFFIK